MSTVTNINGLYILEDEDTQIAMTFEWLDDHGNYTTNDQGKDPILNLPSQGITISTSWPNSQNSSWTLLNPNEAVEDKLKEVVDVLKKLQDRLLVVEEKDDSYFDGKSTLKKAYDKFRMLEALYGKKKDE